MQQARPVCHIFEKCAFRHESEQTSLRGHSKSKAIIQHCRTPPRQAQGVAGLFAASYSRRVCHIFENCAIRHEPEQTGLRGYSKSTVINQHCRTPPRQAQGVAGLFAASWACLSYFGKLRNQARARANRPAAVTVNQMQSFSKAGRRHARPRASQACLQQVRPVCHISEKCAIRHEPEQTGLRRLQ